MNTECHKDSQPSRFVFGRFSSNSGAGNKTKRPEGISERRRLRFVPQTELWCSSLAFGVAVTPPATSYSQGREEVQRLPKLVPFAAPRLTELQSQMCSPYPSPAITQHVRLSSVTRIQPALATLPPKEKPSLPAQIPRGSCFPVKCK